GWYVWHQRRHQINQRQQFRLVCDNVVREAFSDANSAMVRHA
ncbi:transposase, partial [Salmonella enterica subsp. enterica serovar Agona str. 400100 30-11]